MTEQIRCPACRGMKKVPKLGGMTGDCNFCEGKGTISSKEIDAKPVPKKEEMEVSESAEIVSQVAECTPAVIEPIKITDAVIKAVSPNDSKSQAKRFSIQRKKG